MKGQNRLTRGAGAIWIVAVAWLYAAPANADPDCECRLRGGSVALGTCVCMPGTDGPEQACCVMVLNNTSWKFAGKACPLASHEPLPVSPLRDRRREAGREFALRP